MLRKNDKKGEKAKRFESMRHVQVKVYVDRETAELEYKFDKKEIDRREYNKRRRRQRRTEIFNRFKRKPQPE